MSFGESLFAVKAGILKKPAIWFVLWNSCFVAARFEIIFWTDFNLLKHDLSEQSHKVKEIAQYPGAGLQGLAWVLNTFNHNNNLKGIKKIAK